MSEWEWGRVVRITLFNSRESRGARLSPLQAACLLHLKKCSSARQHRHPPTFLQHLPHLAFSSSPDGVSNTWPTPPPYPTDFFSVWCNTHSGASGGPPTITRFFSLFPTNTWPTSPSPASFWRARLCANTVERTMERNPEKVEGVQITVRGWDRGIIEVGEQHAASNKHLQLRWERGSL